MRSPVQSREAAPRSASLRLARVAQLVEQALRKRQVASSILASGSKNAEVGGGESARGAVTPLVTCRSPVQFREVAQETTLFF